MASEVFPQRDQHAEPVAGRTTGAAWRGPKDAGRVWGGSGERGRCFFEGLELTFKF